MVDALRGPQTGRAHTHANPAAHPYRDGISTPELLIELGRLHIDLGPIPSFVFLVREPRGHSRTGCYGGHDTSPTDTNPDAGPEKWDSRLGSSPLPPNPLFFLYALYELCFRIIFNFNLFQIP